VGQTWAALGGLQAVDGQLVIQNLKKENPYE
jgi:hypothetical protein